MEQELRERISSFNIEKEDLRNDIESFCADVSVDLDVRWSLFKDSNLGDIASDYVDFEDLGIDLYGDTNKFETVDLIGEVEHIEAWVANHGDKEKDDLSDWDKKYFGIYTNDNVIAMKERLMDKFTKACIFDW